MFRFHPVTVLGVALVIGVIPIFAIILIFMLAGIGFVIVGKNVGFSFLPLIALVLAGAAFLLGSIGTQAAMAYILLARVRGEAVSFRSCLAATFGKLVPLFGLSTLMAAAFLPGLMAFAIPAAILTTMWSVAPPALLSEKLGVFSALGRSRLLTSGHRWKIFGLGVLIIVLFAVASSVMDTVGTAVNGFGLLAQLGLLGTIVGIVGGFSALFSWSAFNAAWGAVAASLYLELRVAKEGPQADDLAEVFA